MMRSLAGAKLRYAHAVVLVATLVAAAGVTAGLRAPDGPGVTVVLTALLTVILGLGALGATAVSRQRAGNAWETDPSARAFRSPRTGLPILFGLIPLGTVAVGTELAGWRWAHVEPGRGSLLAALTIAPLGLLLLILVGREHQVVLTPDGVTARRPTGSVTIAWDELAPRQRTTDPARPSFRFDLWLVRPDRITRTGLVRARPWVEVSGIRPAFVAATIGYYAAHPADRGAIGTTAEHRRLSGVLHVPYPPASPVPSRRRVTTLLLVGLAMFAAVVALDAGTDGDRPGEGFAGFAYDLFYQVGIITAAVLLAAGGRGLWARLRSGRIDPSAGQGPVSNLPETHPA